MEAKGIINTLIFWLFLPLAATANQQQTAGPSSTSGPSAPVQTEQVTVGDGHASAGQERAQQDGTDTCNSYEVFSFES